MDTSMLSVGIDIGTSTTSMVVSRLHVRNTASCFTVPRVAITGTEIVYRGEIYQTPQTGGNRIDADAVASLLEEEYRRAGITPGQVQTGAVIITGESSRKENAALVTERMSRLAGEFVVAAAGPDLESIIAAKGAGTARYSEELGCSAANFDVGGGTTNIAVFRGGQLCDMALGRDTTPAACAVSRALLAGKPVYLAAEGLPHRASRAAANPRYYAMLEDYVTRLTQFGVQVAPRAELERLLCGQSGKVPGVPEIPAAAPKRAAGETEAFCGVLTAEEARRLAKVCGGTLRLGPGAILTPLARDVLREKGVALTRGEEAPC